MLSFHYQVIRSTSLTEEISLVHLVTQKAFANLACTVVLIADQWQKEISEMWLKAHVSINPRSSLFGLFYLLSLRGNGPRSLQAGMPGFKSCLHHI